MRRYKKKGEVITVSIALLPGAFVEVLPIAPGTEQYRFPFDPYIGRTGAIVSRKGDICDVQFGDDGAGWYLAESLRLV